MAVLAVVLWDIAPAAAAPTTQPQQAPLIFDPSRLLNPVKRRHPRDNDVFLPVNINNWWGHAAQDGDLIVFTAYDWTDYEYDSLLRAVKDGKTGFLKKSGNWHIDPQFHYADRFEDGYAVVGNEDGKYGYINKRGRAHTPMQFDGALRYRESVAAVQVDKLCGFIDKSGRVTIKPRFARVRSFHEGLAVVQLPPAERSSHGSVGFINRRGKFAFLDKTGRVTDLGDFHDGLAKLRVMQPDGSELWGYIDKKFKIKIKPAYQDARDFTRGVAAVRTDEKWGFINKTGRLIVEPRFDAADDFDDTLVMVREKEKWGFADKTGNLRVRAEFGAAEPFFRRCARVQVAPNFGYIDLSGRIIWDPAAAFKEGVIDATPKTRGQVAVSKNKAGDQFLPLPPARRPTGTGYPPEYLYEEELPRKRAR